MKKLASLLTVAALMLTSFSTAFAATKTGNEELIVDVEKIDWAKAEYAEYATDYNWGDEEYDYYMLTYKVKGVSVATTVGTGPNSTKSTGSAISGVEIKTVATGGTIDEDFWNYSVFPYADTSSSYLTNMSVAATNTKAVAYGGSSALYPASGTAGTITEADETVILKQILVTMKNVELTLNYTGSMITLDEFTKNTAGAGTSVEVTLKNNASAIPPVVTPTAPVVTGVDAGTVVTDGVNGKVWNDVKIENATLGTNYRAKFTETVSGKTSTHNFRNLGELGGTATFAVVLNTTRDVANIVLEILYDAVQ